jgi:Flp pilus assembly pilin Flp
MSNMILDVRLAIEALRMTLYKCLSIKSQKGIHIMEYALLCVCLAIALIASLQTVSNAILDLFNTIANAIP